MKNRFVLMGVAALAAAGSSVFADAVNMRFVGTGAGRAVGVQFWVGSTKVMDGNYFVGSLNQQFSGTGLTGNTANSLDGRTLGTFCTDILESVDTRWRVYDVVSAAQAPATGGVSNAAMGASRMSRLSQLYSYGMTTGMLNAFGAWANGDRTAGDNNDRAAAWQLLVWEIVFGDADAANWDLAGALRVAGLTNQVRNYFAQFRDNSRGLTPGVDVSAVARLGAQDQLLVIVPLPPAAYAGMGMLGMVIGAGYIRRRRARLA